MVLSFMNPIILLNKYLYCVVICKFRKRQKYATFCDIGVSIKFITFTAVIDSEMQFLQLLFLESLVFILVSVVEQGTYQKCVNKNNQNLFLSSC